MSTFKFKYTDTDGIDVYGSTEVKFEAETWSDATRRFIDFLRGAGFVITDEDVLMFMSEAVYEYDKANGSITSSHCGLDAAGE